MSPHEPSQPHSVVYGTTRLPKLLSLVQKEEEVEKPRMELRTIREEGDFFLNFSKGMMSVVL